MSSRPRSEPPQICYLSAEEPGPQRGRNGAGCPRPQWREGPHFPALQQSVSQSAGSGAPARQRQACREQGMRLSQPALPPALPQCPFFQGLWEDRTTSQLMCPGDKGPHILSSLAARPLHRRIRDEGSITFSWSESHSVLDQADSFWSNTGLASWAQTAHCL